MHTRFDGLFEHLAQDKSLVAMVDEPELIFCFEQTAGKNSGVVCAYRRSDVGTTILPIRELFDDRIWFVKNRTIASNPAGLDALATYYDDEHRSVTVDLHTLVHAWAVDAVPKVIGFN